MVAFIDGFFQTPIISLCIICKLEVKKKEGYKVQHRKGCFFQKK